MRGEPVEGERLKETDTLLYKQCSMADPRQASVGKEEAFTESYSLSSPHFSERLLRFFKRKRGKASEMFGCLVLNITGLSLQRGV